jgi:serine/threonine protein kinase/tetratricopeptide (TPR) repeat protein
MTPERWQHVKAILGAAIDLESASRESFVRDASAGDADLFLEVMSLLDDDLNASLVSNLSGDMTERPLLTERLYYAALARPAHKRARFLELTCAGDDALLHEIESLVAQPGVATASMDGPTVVSEENLRPDGPSSVGVGQGICPACGRNLVEPVDSDEVRSDTMSSSPENPAQIGPYRILQKIGEGGMGIIYEAEQDRPLRRRVALKVIKRGMDTQRVVARFEAERQALALMSHPGIARVFDGGVTGKGRPYFVMEYVSGIPITEYCDKHRLAVHERLALYRSVCEAVHHAHQKGVIHRDLKPSNVLVTVAEGIPLPKIIDFGIAKATTLKLTDQTLFTQFGEMMGTPAYMSPEQVDMTTLDIDIRTDVYSLGVMLYELLVGALPFEPSDLQARGSSDLRQAILEHEPERPSNRVTLRREDLTGIALKRRTDARTLRRALRGDLDWIVTKTLDKDRTRRYGSASELALDITRHLNDEPILAASPTTSYKLRKFTRRHRAGVAAGILLVLSLGGGIAGTSIGLLRAVRAERASALEAEAARQVSDFLTGLFRISDPEKARGKEITAREILDQGVQEIAQGLREEPLVKARLMDTMGEVYMNLGLYETAGKLFEQSLVLRRGTLGEEHPDIASSLSHLGELRFHEDRYAQAELLHRQALFLRETTLGPLHPDTARSLFLIGDTMAMKGEPTKAIEYLSRALPVFEASLGPEDSLVARCLQDMGVIYVELHDYETASDLFRRALKRQEKTEGPDSPNIAMTLNNLAYALTMQGRYAEAEPMAQRAISTAERALGSGHPFLVSYLHTLGELLRRQSHFDEANKTLERARAIAESGGVQESADMGNVLDSLGRLAESTNDLARAESLHRRSLAVRMKVVGADHIDVADSLDGLARVLRKNHRDEEAMSAEERSRIIRARYGNAGNK